MLTTSYFELFLLSLILLLPFLYETSHVFRYYFKYCLYGGIVSFISLCLIPFLLFRPCDVRNLVLASSFCHHVSTLIGLKWELRGKEHLEKERACVIVANHQSCLDVLGMFDIWPIMAKCTVVAKREIFYVWPFGLGAWLCGLIFINRMHSDKARDQLNEATEKIKRKNIKLWIFPEGTRRNTGELHPFKKGAFHVAIKAQIPILPVVYSSYKTFLDDKNRNLTNGKIIITTLPAIPTEGLTTNDIESLMERTHKLMYEQYKITSNEIQQCFTIEQQQGKNLNNEKLLKTDNILISSSADNMSSSDIPSIKTQLKNGGLTTSTIQNVDNNTVKVT